MFLHPRTVLPTLVLASAVVAWGCTRPPAVVVDDSKTRALEARVAKLEQDVKAAIAAREGLQHKLTAAEDLIAQLEARAAAAERDRDLARAGLTARTAERDATLAQYDSFRKSIRELLGQADTAASSLPVPLVTTISLPTVPRGGL
jgi:chromosome segregation ATPase